MATLKKTFATTPEKAFQIIEKYIPLNTKESNGLTASSAVIAQTQYAVSAEASDGPWSQSKDSLQRTLRYVMEHLNLSCYVLCVGPDGRAIEIVKVQNSKKMPPHIVEAIASLPKDPRNLKHIETVLKKPYKVMQCILKPIQEGETFSEEYASLLGDMRDLPPGVFLLNLTDAVLLRKDGGEPFANLFPGGRALPAEYSLQSGSRFLPILSTSGQEGYWDVTIPNYDDVEYVLRGLPTQEFVTEWSQKTVAKAVFRGGPGGCGWSAETNPRLHLAERVFQEPIIASLVDAGIISDDAKLSFVKSGNVRVDRNGVGRIDTKIPPVKRVSMVEQSRYKYIIHVDGNVQAGRLLLTMRTGSLILRVKGPYTAWLDSMLKEGVHYVGIKADLSDLEERIRWCLKNDAKCRRIAANSLKLALQVSSREYLESALRKSLYIVATAGARTNELAATSESGPNGCRPLIRGKRRRPRLVQAFYDTKKSPYTPAELTPQVVAVPNANAPEKISPGKKKEKSATRKNKLTVANQEPTAETARTAEILLGTKIIDGMPEFINKTGAKCPNGYEKYPPNLTLCRKKTAKKK